MELNDLKSTWDRFSSAEGNRNQLKEADLHTMLSKRSRTLIDTIDRNVRYGITILIILTLYFIIDDYILGPSMAKSEGISLPKWIFWLDTIKSIFILISFISFIIRYYHVKKNISHYNSLKVVLKHILRLLKTYKVLFYIALGILLITFGVNYITGMFYGIELSAYRQGVSIFDLDRTQAFRQLAMGLLLILSIVIILFFLLRWIFRRLYGRYISKLQNTLLELEEIE